MWPGPCPHGRKPGRPGHDLHDRVSLLELEEQRAQAQREEGQGLAVLVGGSKHEPTSCSVDLLCQAGDHTRQVEGQGLPISNHLQARRD